jgi:hypothetical protein
VGAKALDQGEDDLVHGLAKLRSCASRRCDRAPDLTHGKPVGDGFGAQPKVDGESRGVMVPDVLFETVGRKASGAAELGAERLVESDAVKGADERAHKLSDEHTIAGMPPITRREELDLGARNGRDEIRDAFRTRRRTARIEDDEDFGLRQIDGRKDRAQGRVLSRQAMVRRHHAMERPQGVRRQHEVGLAERCGANQLGCPVGRATVGIDHDGTQPRKIARETHMHGANDVHHRSGVVQRRQPNQDIDLAHGHQLLEQRIGKSALVLHGVICPGDVTSH